MGICSIKQKRENLGSDVPKDFWSIDVEEINGRAIKLNEFKQKKALIIVNTNEKIPTTSKPYLDLTRVCEKYGNRGLEVLVFPSKKDSNSKNRDKDYAVVAKQGENSNLKIFSSVQMNGQSTHPLYKYLRTNSPLYNTVKRDCALVKSEFTKFLVDRFGNVVKMYMPNVDAKVIENDLDNLLRLT